MQTEIDRIFDEHKRRTDKILDDFSAAVKADVRKGVDRAFNWLVVIILLATGAAIAIGYFSK